LVARSLTQIRRKHCNDRLRASVQQTIELAITDDLTGLHNRRYLDTHMKLLIDRASARGRPLSICITDIDRFKLVNDTYGHDAGDEVLREFANRVRATVRGADLACRFGGEEFVIVMPDTTPEMAAIVAERLRLMVEGRAFGISQEDTVLTITASLGIATLRPHEDTAEALLKRADTALYQAKNNGRNRVVAAAA
jgi:two-component system cell cycle response regulator